MSTHTRLRHFESRRSGKDESSAPTSRTSISFFIRLAISHLPAEAFNIGTILSKSTHRVNVGTTWSLRAEDLTFCVLGLKPQNTRNTRKNPHIIYLPSDLHKCRGNDYPLRGECALSTVQTHNSLDLWRSTTKLHTPPGETRLESISICSKRLTPPRFTFPNPLVLPIFSTIKYSVL